MHLFQSRLPQYLGILGGLACAVFAGLLTSGYFGNPISALAPVAAILAMLYAAVDYRRGLFCLIAISGYLDFVKRILLVDGAISFVDVTSVLAVAPVLTAGLFLGCYLPLVILRRRSVVGIEWSLFYLACVLLSLFVAATAVKTKDWSDTIKLTGQSGIYIMMIPLAYSLFASRPLAAIQQLFRFMLLVFIPVGAYGLWQLAFGYSGIEIAYMKSGFTQTLDLLLTNQLRPFSTVNSPQAYGTIMYFLMIFSLYNAQTVKKLRPVWLGIFVFYFIADFLSTQRGPAVVSIFSLISMYWFTSRQKTVAIYAFGISAFALILFNARWLHDNLLLLDSYIPRTSDTGFQGQMFSIGTFRDRLDGFMNVLGNPNVWTLFGDWRYDWRTNEDADVYNHDILSQILLRFGVVGMILLVGSMAAFLFIAHRRVFEIKDEDRRRLTALLLNLVVMFLFLNLIGPGFQIFPLNTYIYMFVGLIFAISFPHQKAAMPPARIVGRERLGYQSPRGALAT